MKENTASQVGRVSPQHAVEDNQYYEPIPQYTHLVAWNIVSWKNE